MDAVNSCPKLSIVFPKFHEEQKRIAEKIKLKSSVKFDNCAGCIDRMLIWTSKSSLPVLALAQEFFLWKEKRFGLNMQVIYDHKRDSFLLISHILQLHPTVWLLGLQIFADYLKVQFV